MAALPVRLEHCQCAGRHVLFRCVRPQAEMGVGLLMVSLLAAHIGCCWHGTNGVLQCGAGLDEPWQQPRSSVAASKCHAAVCSVGIATDALCTACWSFLWCIMEVVPMLCGGTITRTHCLQRMPGAPLSTATKDRCCKVSRRAWSVTMICVVLSGLIITAFM